MDIAAYLGDIESDPIEDNRSYLLALSFVAIVSAGFHWYATCYASGVIDFVFGLTEFCVSVLLLGAGLVYEKIIWSHELLKNFHIFAYCLDIFYSIVIFWILNIGLFIGVQIICPHAAWETPSKGYRMDAINEIYEGNDHEDGLVRRSQNVKFKTPILSSSITSNNSDR
ncbi:hypothetical protein X943_000386 [Babesia divergens]|uniref:Uncharacterized protein n=1 Tax=Babesia divergens TaxID=32595 RepID=A0AAD9GJ39_BABDI|nr:hypothetical protein X943_000386 [Babesia divergens]